MFHTATILLQDCLNSCAHTPRCRSVIGQQKPFGNPFFKCAQFTSVCTRVASPCTDCPSQIDRMAVHRCQGNQSIVSNMTFIDETYIFCYFLSIVQSIGTSILHFVIKAPNLVQMIVPCVEYRVKKYPLSI